jgi:hypothetical protein
LPGCGVGFGLHQCSEVADGDDLIVRSEMLHESHDVEPQVAVGELGPHHVIQVETIDVGGDQGPGKVVDQRA